MSDKLYLYVGCWGPGAAGGGEGEGISILSFDQETGAMEKLGVYKDEEPAVMFVSEDSKYMYVTNELMTYGGKFHAGGLITALKINEDGSLSEINVVPSMGAGPMFCSLDPTGKYLCVVNHGTLDGVTKFRKQADGKITAEVVWDDANLVLFPVREDGGLGEPIDIYTFEGEGSFLSYKDDPAKANHGYPGKQQAPAFILQNSPHAHCVRFFKNGIGVVCERGTDSVYIFEIDYENEKLVILDRQVCRLGSGPRHVATHPTLPYFYATNELENSVTAFAVDLETKTFKEIQTIASLEEDSESVNAPSDITISKCGTYVYAGNRGDNSIAVYKVDAESGKLELVQIKKIGGLEPRGVELSPNGKFFVTGQKVRNKLESYAVDAETGKLSDVCCVVDVLTPTCMRFARP
ncbi:MAG: lactonase family protein [Mogibacterium sp.]|nr:lactonase family protein [Mogibacterium sp.]